MSKVKYSLFRLGLTADCNSGKWDLPHQSGCLCKRHNNWGYLPFVPHFVDEMSTTNETQYEYKYPPQPVTENKFNYILTYLRHLQTYLITIYSTIVLVHVQLKRN